MASRSPFDWRRCTLILPNTKHKRRATMRRFAPTHQDLGVSAVAPRNRASLLVDATDAKLLNVTINLHILVFVSIDALLVRQSLISCGHHFNVRL
jgi:hypothetical protein